jgi:hypothetical protein
MEYPIGVEFPVPGEGFDSSACTAADSFIFLVKTDASYVPHRSFLDTLYTKLELIGFAESEQQDI